MRRVTPRIFLIANSKFTLVNSGRLDVGQWLKEFGEDAVTTYLNMQGPDAEVLVELAARRCYKSYAVGLNPNVTRIRSDSAAYHANILESGHGSVLEHASATWAIEDCSRVFTHELVRNRVGNAFSQESLRYVRLTDLGFWYPPEIDDDPTATAIFDETVRFLEQQQRRLAEHFQIDSKGFADKKRLTSAFRRIAPIGLATGIVLTANMRSLRWMIEQRTSPAAEIEIRYIFNRIAYRALKEWPAFFADFQTISTGDGDDIKHWVPKHSKV